MKRCKIAGFSKLWHTGQPELSKCCLQWQINSQQQRILIYIYIVEFLPSVLWHCWLGGRKGIRPVKNWAVGCWHGYLPAARCRLAYVPADATVSCFSKIQIGFTFLVPAHPGSPGQRVILSGVCVCGVKGVGCLTPLQSKVKSLV